MRGVRDEAGLWRVPLNKDSNSKGDLCYSTRRTQTVPPAPERANLVHETLNSTLGKKWMANNVYELPTIAQGVRWMHAVRGYPVKSTWIKAIRADNFLGWPLLSVENVNKQTSIIRKPQSVAPEYTLHQAKASSTPHSGCVSSKREARTRCVFQNIRSKREDVLRSNRPLPPPLPTRIQIHHGHGGN